MASRNLPTPCRNLTERFIQRPRQSVKIESQPPEEDVFYFTLTPPDDTIAKSEPGSMDYTPHWLPIGRGVDIIINTIHMKPEPSMNNTRVRNVVLPDPPSFKTPQVSQSTAQKLPPHNDSVELLSNSGDHALVDDSAGESEASTIKCVDRPKTKAEKILAIRQNAIEFAPILREIENRLWAAKYRAFSESQVASIKEESIIPDPEKAPMTAEPMNGNVPVIPGSITKEEQDIHLISPQKQNALDTKPVPSANQQMSKPPGSPPGVGSGPVINCGSEGSTSGATRSVSSPMETPTPQATPQNNINVASQENLAQNLPQSWTPPHLRNLPHLQKRSLGRNASVVAAQPAATESSGAGLPTPSKISMPPAVKATLTSTVAKPTVAKRAGNQFRTPGNLHAAGYDITALLKDPNERVDVKGLKFTAWPKPVNRGDMPIKEARRVIISGFPINLTLEMVSIVCKDTGKVEDVEIDETRRKALVTFMQAQVAHNFYVSAQKNLELVLANPADGSTTCTSLFVQMDYPIDMLPYTIQERIYSGNASRMVLLGGWEKHNLEKAVGKPDEGDQEIPALLTRLASSYAAGGKAGRVEAVSFQDAGWGYLQGSLLFAGILDAITAHDGLIAEPELKGCYVSFGKDPCDPMAA